MKKVIIVHCWDGYPEYCWYPYVKKELENKEFQVEVPVFPETELPKKDKWVPKLQEVVGEPSEDVFLVGHSIGCATIMRYLESLSEDQKIGGVVLVAGFTDDLGFEEIANYFTTSLDFEKIKKHCDRFILIHSNNDPYVDLKYGDELKQKLNGELIILHNKGHFSGEVDNEDSCIELPEVVESIIKISK